MVSGPRGDGLAKQLEARLFDRSGDAWTVVPDIRERVSFAYGDVLSAEFQQFKNYDLVLGQNFMIHMNDALVENRACVAGRGRTIRRCALSRRDGSRHQDRALVARHKLVPLDWNIAAIHDADEMRRSAWPWYYWSLEPISRRRRDYLTRYSTIFLKP